tara:strand:- start:1104 stop:1277 length:174 start_codon:yes stop_codon:yes gene_type:complete
MKKSCKNCKYIHLKLRWKFDPPRDDIFCGVDCIGAHEGIKPLPEEKICDRWKERFIY